MCSSLAIILGRYTAAADSGFLGATMGPSGSYLPVSPAFGSFYFATSPIFTTIPDLRIFCVPDRITRSPALRPFRTIQESLYE